MQRRSHGWWHLGSARHDRADEREHALCKLQPGLFVGRPERSRCPADADRRRCVSVGTRRGYNIINCDPFGRVISNTDGARGIVEMLFCTSLLALVGASDQPQSSPRKLQIVNTKVSHLRLVLMAPRQFQSVNPSSASFSSPRPFLQSR